MLDGKECKCGHKDWDHYPEGKRCQSLKEKGTYCTCSKFRPKENK